jgi:Arc/MetJ-type ribon-helix-helix transcriptional regulator
MSVRIAVRLPGDLVAFVDELVTLGEAGSRAQVISLALERERRRRGAERDATVYGADRAAKDPDKLDVLIAQTSRTALDDLD